MLPFLPSHSRLLPCALALLLVGCRLEVRAPDAVPAETDVVASTVTAWYAAAAARDTLAWDRLVSPAATMLLPGTQPRLVPVRVLLDIPGVRGAGALRVVRADARLDRGTALVRVTVARPAPDASVEEETVDHVTLARMDSTWRVAHVVTGSWRRRSGAP
jgi:hypothetical protein